MKTTNLWLLLFLALAVAGPCLASSIDNDSTCSEEDAQEPRNAATDAANSDPRNLYTVLGKPKEFTPSMTSNVQLAVRRWIPDDIQSVVLFVHGGAGWHSGYAAVMGESLKSAGIAVVAYDTMGSGHSTGVNGLRNYFPSIDALVDDVTMMIQKVRAEFPGKRVFSVGESFGCMVLVSQILKEQEQQEQGAGDSGSLADGYVLTGPVIKILPEMLPPKPIISILNFLARFFPMLTMPGTDFFSTFDLAFGDPKWAATGRDDPIIQEAAVTPPKLGMAASILTNMNSMYDRLHDVNVPFKILMGSKEGRVDVDAVKHLAKVAKSTDKEIEIVDGAFHQLFQDVPELTQTVCQKIQQWVLHRS